ncbi:MAG: hypothetical protein ACXAC8_10220 [Candidatus Hodarchaeales archaeon]|jgi:hypothetical protein
MPEVPIPGMAFRARLSKKEGRNVVELIFRGQSITTIDMSDQLTDSAIANALQMACVEADIEHQVPHALLGQVAGDLYKEAELAAGKTLVPTEFEIDEEATELDKKLSILVTSLQKVHKRLDKIEELLETSLKG